MSLREKLQKIAAEGQSDWLEETGKRLANRDALKNARKVALRVLHILQEEGISQTALAAKMGVSRQQVTKIVKGKENFTFETIDKLEKALGITLITIEIPNQILIYGSAEPATVANKPAKKLPRVSPAFGKIRRERRRDYSPRISRRSPGTAFLSPSMTRLKRRARPH